MTPPSSSPPAAKHASLPGQQQHQHDALLARAAAVQPVLQEHSAWAEQHGRLHEDVLAALVHAGVPRLYLPVSLGGLAVAPTTCAAVCEILAAADPAAAWHVMVFNAARIMAVNWPEQMVARLWADNPDTLVAASGHTPFVGRRQADTVLVNGRNSFVSGCHHADYVMSPMLLDGEMCTVAIPASLCEIQDNWDTLGMRGTGSNDVTVTDAEVSMELVAPTSDGPANRYYSDPLYQCPSRVVFATYIPVALQLARSALDELENLARNKVPYASDSKLKSRPLAQFHYGKALAGYRSARSYFFATLEQVWQQAGASTGFSATERADLYLAGTHAMQTCADVVRQVADAAGSSVFDRAQPLERIVRDMETLRHHGFANESRYASVAQVLWDTDLDYPLLLR